MTISFDKVFRPTKEDQIFMCKMIVDFHRNHVGECSTCKWLTPPPSDLPGFVTDYGDCVLSKDIFYDKVCLRKDLECDAYEENTSELEYFLSEIERLKGDIAND